MKRLCLFAFLFSFHSLNAQVAIKLWDYQSQDVTGNTINGTEQVVTASSDGEYAITINFKNTSGIVKEWKIERFRILNTLSWEDRLNWGVANDPLQEQGYSPNQMNTNPWAVAWGYSVDPGSSLNLTATTSVQGGGEELYRYYLVENGTRADSIDYRITTMALGVGNNENETGVAVFPNPASDVIMIQTSGDPDAIYECMLLDACGKMALEMACELKQIALKNVENGLYTVILYKNKIPVRATKVVVHH